MRRKGEPASRWPFWCAWPSSGLYVRVALLPRLPLRQTFKHLFCVYDTEEEIKRPPGEKEKEKKNPKTRSDSGGLSGKMERETRSGTGFERTVSRWLPWVWEVRFRIPRARTGRRASTLLVTNQGKKWPMIEGLMCAEPCGRFYVFSLILSTSLLYRRGNQG